MHQKNYLIRASIISFVCLIGFSLIALFISNHKINVFDSSIIAYVQGLESSGLTSIMKTFTFIGSTIFVIFLTFILIIFCYKVLKQRVELILLLSAIIGSAILNGILKQIFQRPRPEIHRLIEVGGYSFPSGHAMSAFTLYGILTFLLWNHIQSKWGKSILVLFSVIMIIAIGTSRIYLGVHYPSDVIGGFFASGFCLATLIWVFQYYREKRYNKIYKSGI